MPALPPVPNVLKVTTRFNVGSDLSVSTGLHFRYTGTAPTSTTCAAIATSIYNLAVTNLVPSLANANSLTCVDVVDLTSATSGAGSHDAVTAGTDGADPLPAEVCVLMNIAIARRYRGGKPRAYWPLGISTDLQTPQQWGSVSLASFLSHLATYIDGIMVISSSGTTLGTMCSVSYYSGFTVRPNPIVPGVRSKNVSTPRTVPLVDDFTGISINPRPGSQRRREGH